MQAHFRRGELLCSNPDDASKTCSAIDRLTFASDGSARNTGEVLISPDQPVTLEVISAAVFEGEAMCGTADLDDLRRGVVRANRVRVPPDRNAKVLERLQAVFKPLAGQRLCEALQVRDGRLVKLSQAERVEIPLPAKPVRWIKPDDGYRVAPRLIQP